MIKPPKNDNEQLAMDAFQGLQPFTITINKAEDAMFLSLALMTEVTGNSDLTQQSLKHMIGHAKIVGVEAAVKEFFEQATDCNVSYPDFIKPVLIIMLSHMFEHKERIHELVKKTREKEKP